MSGVSAQSIEPMGLQSLLVNDLRPNVLLPQRLAHSSPVSDAPLEAGLLGTDSSDSDSGPPFLQASHPSHRSNPCIWMLLSASRCRSVMLIVLMACECRTDWWTPRTTAAAAPSSHGA